MCGCVYMFNCVCVSACACLQSVTCGACLSVDVHASLLCAYASLHVHMCVLVFACVRTCVFACVYADSGVCYVHDDRMSIAPNTLGLYSQGGSWRQREAQSLIFHQLRQRRNESQMGAPGDCPVRACAFIVTVSEERAVNLWREPMNQHQVK